MKKNKGKKVLYTASVVKTHIMQFHIPYLKLLKDLGYTTYVAAKNDYDNKDDCKIPYCDYYIDIDFARSPFSFKNISAYKKLKDLIYKENFDIIHCHTPSVSILTRQASKHLKDKGTRIIYTAHGFHFFKGGPLKNWIYYPIEKHYSRYTDSIVTINREDYKLALDKFNCDDVIYIKGIGIDYNKYSKDISQREINKIKKELNINKDGFVLISVGELQARKNHRVVIEALNKIKNKNIYYILVGQGELYNEYNSLIKEYKLEDNIKLLGYRNDVNKLLKCSDVIIHPSIREGLGLSALEGMASGLPLISSNVNGMKDYTEDNKTGVCVNPYSIDDMVSAINRLYNDNKFKEKCGRYNKKVAKKFSIDKSLKTIKKLYEKD